MHPQRGLVIELDAWFILTCVPKSINWARNVIYVIMLSSDYISVKLLIWESVMQSQMIISWWLQTIIVFLN